MTSSPVALFIFNRPELTSRLFDVVRRARPATLLIVADGPRADRPDDIEACAAVRAAVSRVDWPCRIETNVADANLGIRRRLDTGLAWVFDTVDQAILLEDDCLPDHTFFPYCDELLKRYDNDPRVLSIAGNNFQQGVRRGAASYYFSRYGHTWGWATWRRAWALYDPYMREWPDARAAGWIDGLFADPHARQYWSYIFDTNHASREHWDYAWNFSYWRHGGVHIVPSVNLVSNLGFDARATHTSDARSVFARLPAQSLALPLVHPEAVSVDRDGDAHTEDVLYSGILRRTLRRIRARTTAP